MSDARYNSVYSQGLVPPHYPVPCLISEVCISPDYVAVEYINTCLMVFNSGSDYWEEWLPSDLKD